MKIIKEDEMCYKNIIMKHPNETDKDYLKRISQSYTIRAYCQNFIFKTRDI